MQLIHGLIADIPNRRFYAGTINVEKGRIQHIEPLSPDPNARLPYIIPGFTDAHVHIESSMLIPAEFAKLAVVHGTVSTISDPHEIANVCGIEGIDFISEHLKTVPFKFNFGAPSCVPATIFETAGASINAAETERLLQRDDIGYLSEMMNFPGVLHGDEEVMKKIAAAHRLGKPVDGHAPGLRGEQARQYIAAGISTDHECFTAEEALDKLSAGMKILIREGSAAKNFEALIPLLKDYPNEIMFCSDDKHPDSLVAGHINQLCARAIAHGIDLFHVLQAACINPVLHYKTNTGLLRAGDPADFVLIKDMQGFEVLATYIDGQKVAENGQSLIKTKRPASAVNRFNRHPIQREELAIAYEGQPAIDVIEALDGQLITGRLTLPPLVAGKKIISDTTRDILKIVVVNRYSSAPLSKSFIRNFGLKQGAIASSVAHDSHNIVAIGVDDESLCQAINLVIASQGGISCVAAGAEMVIELPVGGLMSLENGYDVAGYYTAIDAMAKSLGSALGAPFMTLSFMALLVIPHLKLSDRGLFDGDKFEFVAAG